MKTETGSDGRADEGRPRARLSLHDADTMRVAAAVLLLSLLGCATPPVDPAGARSSSRAGTAAGLIAALSESGLDVQDAGIVPQPFFDVPAHVFVVGGDDLQIYEFSTLTAAEAAASQVAPDGSSIGTTAMSWLAPPHFFRRDRLIVNYLGSADRTLTELQRHLGQQFAGR